MMGPLAVTRFDLVPGVLAGASVLLLATRPRLSAVFVVLGAALKLWPAVLLPALAAPVAHPVAGRRRDPGLRRSRSWSRPWRSAGSTACSRRSPGSPTAACRSSRCRRSRSWSPGRSSHDPWTVDFSRFITSQVSGPGDRLLINLATLATVAALVVMAALWLRAWRRGATISAETVGWIMLTTTGLLILTNKVFSPQYLLWLSPVAIAMVAVAPRADTGVRRFVVLLLSVGILTQLIYPILYLWISGVYWANPLGVMLLAIRDVALIGFVVYAGRRAWRETAALPVEPATAA